MLPPALVPCSVLVLLLASFPSSWVPLFSLAPSSAVGPLWAVVPPAALVALVVVLP